MAEDGIDQFLLDCKTYDTAHQLADEGEKSRKSDIRERVERVLEPGIVVRKASVGDRSNPSFVSELSTALMQLGQAIVENGWNAKITWCGSIDRKTAIQWMDDSIQWKENAFIPPPSEHAAEAARRTIQAAIEGNLSGVMRLIELGRNHSRSNRYFDFVGHRTLTLMMKRQVDEWDLMEFGWEELQQCVVVSENKEGEIGRENDDFGDDDDDLDDQENTKLSPEDEAQARKRRVQVCWIACEFCLTWGHYNLSKVDWSRSCARHLFCLQHEIVEGGFLKNLEEMQFKINATERPGWSLINLAVEHARNGDSPSFETLIERDERFEWCHIFSKPIPDAFFELSTQPDSTKNATQPSAFDEIDETPEQAQPVSDDLIEGDEINSGWHEANSSPDKAIYRAGPLTGTKKKLTCWIYGIKEPKKGSERRLNTAIAKGTYWGRSDGPARFSVWFKKQERFAEANSRRLAEEHPGTS